MGRWILILIIVLVAVRIALPYAVKAYVNHTLNKAHDYGGRIGDIDMSLWRGGYQINKIEIFKKNGDVHTPFFSAPEIDLFVQWRELFHGAVVGRIVLRQPRANFVSGPTKQQSQDGKNERWDKMLESLFPFKLNRVEIVNGQIHFKNPFSDPPVDIYLKQITATATNLTNARDYRQKLPSGLFAKGSTVGGGQLNLRLQMNLLKPDPTYELNCGLTNVNLVALNDFMRAYGKFDVDRGTFAIFTSVAGDGGNYDGYVKIFFDHLDVFAWQKERQKNILKIFWEAIVSGAAFIFKNHPEDQLATKVPISGSYTNSNIGIWTATANVLQNAFVRALLPKLDQPVTVQQVKKTEEKKVKAK